MKPKQTEKQIENAILEYLDAKGYYAIKHNRIGVYDAAQGTFRKPKSKYQRVGIADIQFFWKGILKITSSAYGHIDGKMGYQFVPSCLTIFLEVKTKTGKQSEAQKEFEIMYEL